MNIHGGHMNNWMMQNHHMMVHGQLMHHGFGIIAMLLLAMAWGALMLTGWRFLRNGQAWYKLFGVLLLGIGLLPLSGLLIPILLIVVLVKVWKKGKALASEREWVEGVSTTVAAASANTYSRVDVLDEWERKVRFEQKQTKGE